MANNSEKYDVQLTCRSCLCESNEMVSLLSIEDKTQDDESQQQKTIGELMMECADVQIKSDDGLPQKVCGGCVSQLQSAFAYRKQCQRSESKLREYFKHHSCIGHSDIELEPMNNDGEMVAEEHWFEDDRPQLDLSDDNGDSEGGRQMANDRIENEIVDGEDLSAEEKSVEYRALDTQPDEVVSVGDKTNRINSTSRSLSDGTTERIPFVIDEGGGEEGIDNPEDDEDSRILARAKRLNGKWQCEICNRFLSSRHNLTGHVRLHFGKKSERCTICVKSFITKSALRKHMKVHNKPREIAVYTCDICQRSCTTKNGLSLHMRSHETTRGIGVIQTKSVHVDADADSGKELCPYCGKSMPYAQLVVHLRRHTGEKPYACDLCDKAFPRSTELKHHQLVHTGEKTIKCTQCDKAFARSDRLRRHMRIHTKEKPYACPHCDRAFSQSSDLVLHVRRHTGEKPYGCSVCGERFYLNTLLKKHRQTRGHFGAEPLQPRLPSHSVNNVR